MLLFFATERLYRRASRRALPPPGKEERRRELVAFTASPLDPLVAGAPRGTRYQLFRALRAMASGEAMVVEQRIPSLLDHFENAGKRETWFQSLRNSASWTGGSGIEPILVPGTAFPGIIGRIMLRSGWCAPSDEPHWVPNLRLFFLTEIGYQSFCNAQAWWRGLTPLQRMRLIFAE